MPAIERGAHLAVVLVDVHLSVILARTMDFVVQADCPACLGVDKIFVLMHYLYGEKTKYGEH
jgi:hypothetical protein